MGLQLTLAEGRASEPRRDRALRLSVITWGMNLKLYQERHHYPEETPKISEGRMPSPGKCRIWYPDRPPGHPPSGDCEYLGYQVPPGSGLIEG